MTDTTLRDRIADTLPAFQDGYILPEDVADAIIEVLHDSIPDLVWRDSYGVIRAETAFGDYMITHRGKILRMCCAPGNPEMLCSSLEASQAAANAHHKAGIMKALGLPCEESN